MLISRLLFYYFICLVLGIFRGLSADNRSDKLIIYPPPPDSARIQFLTSISTSSDITGQRSGFMRYILGDEEERPIFKPYGIASLKGKLYICDSQLAGLEIIDLKNRKFDYFNPTGRGQLYKPINCALDEAGYLYVVDTGRNQVVIFDQSLQYFDSFGEPSQFKPTDIKILNEKIWVCDLESKKIQVFNRTTRKLIYSFPEANPQDSSYLFLPTNLFVTDEKIYMSDFGDFKIKIYDLDGKYERSIGSYGQHPGQFVRPKGIAVDDKANLYVVDAGFENVQLFDSQDQLLLFFGGNYKNKGDMWLPAKVSLDYENLFYFQKFVDRKFELKYLIYVTNQFGPDKINVYGFIEYR